MALNVSNLFSLPQSPCARAKVDNLQPWRANMCNISDTIMTLGLVILLLCGALFIEEPPEKEAIAALGGFAVGQDMAKDLP